MLYHTWALPLPSNIKSRIIAEIIRHGRQYGPEAFKFYVLFFPDHIRDIYTAIRQLSDADMRILTTRIRIMCCRSAFEHFVLQFCDPSIIIDEDIIAMHATDMFNIHVAEKLINGGHRDKYLLLTAQSEKLCAAYGHLLK